MILSKPSDAAHKYQMYRLLTAILNDTALAQSLTFKGGTCASLRGWLDRFSVDLDFDLIDVSQIETFRKKLHHHFDRLNLTVKDESQRHLQFFLKYDAALGIRNTLKLEINDDVSPLNETEVATLDELNLLARTQTQSTMVANKMAAALNRVKQHHTVAGRDFYDLHYFLSHGYRVNPAIVAERMGEPFEAYLHELIMFVDEKLTDQDLYEDLNPLLEKTKLNRTIKNLRSELLWLLKGM